jgi:elongation factor 1 alpha-like protein
LWHYYYDVDKSIAYLLKQYVAKPKKEQKKKVTGGFCLFLSTSQMHERWVVGGWVVGG